MTGTSQHLYANLEGRRSYRSLLARQHRGAPVSSSTDIARIGSEEGAFQYRHARASVPKRTPVHIHSCYEVYYSLTDRLEMQIEGNKYTLSKHDIVVLNCKEMHSSRTLSGDYCEHIIVHFRPRFLLDFQSPFYNMLGFLEKHRLGNGNVIPNVNDQNKAIYQHLLRIEDYVKNPCPESLLMIRTLFAQMLALLNNCAKRGAPSEHGDGDAIENCHYDTRIVEIVSFIQNHLSEDLSLARLENEFGLSRHYLCRLFKRNTGYTVHEYVTNRRVIHAMRLLAEGKSAFESADAAGFNDYSNFYKAFRRVAGATPAEVSRSASSAKGDRAGSAVGA